MTPSTEREPLPEGERPVRVAAIGDLHVGETHAGRYRELFAEISQHADVLVLCGDLTNYGKSIEAENLAEDLRACTIPCVAVLGNHDHESNQPDVVTRYLAEVGVRMLDNGEAHEIHGIGFAGCMGAMGGFGRGMLSAFGESYVKHFVRQATDENLKLETSLRMLRTRRAMVVLHYAPIPGTLDGEPLQIFPFLGNSRLAETVDHAENVTAVVHGHAHRGVFRGQTPKGVPVYNCAQFVVQAACGRPYAIIDM